MKVTWFTACDFSVSPWAQHFSNKFVSILEILLYSCCLSCKASVIFVVTKHFCMVVWSPLTLPQRLKCLLYKSTVRSECWCKVKWIDQSSLGTLCQHLHYLADAPHLKNPSSDSSHTKKKNPFVPQQRREWQPHQQLNRRLHFEVGMRLKIH